jgi:hypothetical protein
MIAAELVAGAVPAELVAGLVDAIDHEAEDRYRRRLAAAAAAAERERAWSAGYAAAVADIKAAEHALTNHLRGLPREVERWAVRGEPRTRAEFGKPHPGDYPGKGAA